MSIDGLIDKNGRKQTGVSRNNAAGVNATPRNSSINGKPNYEPMPDEDHSAEINFI